MFLLSFSNSKNSLFFSRFAFKRLPLILESGKLYETQKVMQSILWIVNLQLDRAAAVFMWGCGANMVNFIKGTCVSFQSIFPCEQKLLKTSCAFGDRLTG